MRAVLLMLALCPWAGAASQPATVDLRVEKATLSALIERIAKQCDAGVAMHTGVEAAMRQQVTVMAKDAKWSDAVSLLEHEYNVTIALVGDRLEVSDADSEFAKRLVRRMYDVRTLVIPEESFPGVDLDIPEPGGRGAMLLPPITSDRKPETSQIAEVLKQVRPESWQRGGVSIEIYQGGLVVWQLPEVHDEILALLQRLERAAARQVVCRIYRLAKPPADASTVVTGDQWMAIGPSAGAPIGCFVSLDQQVNHLFAGVQQTYIADADVVQQAYDPIVTVLSQGLCVEVEPHVTIDGIVATTRLTATVEQDGGSAPVIDARGKALVTIKAPRLRADLARDTRLIPRGGAAIYRFGDRTYAVSFEAVQPTGTIGK
jgi:hypothetical protein